MDRFCTDTRPREPLRYFIGPVFCPGKDQGGRDGVVFEDMQQQAAFILFIHEIQILLDRLRGRGGGRHLYFGRIHQDRPGQLLDLGRHRCGKEKRMLLSGKLSQDLADIVDETHVQHAVGLIQNKIPDMPEIEQFLIAQVEETPRSGYQDIYPAL